MIHEQLEVVSQIVRGVVAPPDKEVLPVPRLRQSIVLGIQSNEMGTIPCPFFHHQYILVELNAVLLGKLPQRHNLASFLGGGFKGLDVGGVVVAADKALDDAAGADSYLTWYLLDDVASVFVDGEFELVVGI